MGKKGKKGLCWIYFFFKSVFANFWEQEVIDDWAYLIRFLKVKSVTGPLHHNDISLRNIGKDIAVKVRVIKDFFLKRPGAIHHQARPLEGSSFFKSVDELLIWIDRFQVARKRSILPQVEEKSWLENWVYHSTTNRHFRLFFGQTCQIADC